MRKFTKNIVKEFKTGFGRFVAIMAIVALGVGFLIGIMQATPDMRRSMSNYYIDNIGSMMPLSRHYVAHVLVASGYVEKEFAKNELYKFALYLQDNEFWNDQIEQIYVDADKNVELIPRVGNHRIILGSFDNFPEKLDNLKLFYEQAIPKVGWEKYSTINLKYKNQIVCTKR